MIKILYLIISLMSFSSFAGADIKTFIPTQARTFIPLLKEQQEKYWVDHPMPYVFASLIEHESCISLVNKRCWNPKSELKTQREQGVGFGQITRAYKADGSIRFDALQELKDRHPVLSDWNWSNVYVRPDLQLAAVVLKTKDDYKKLYMVKDPVARLHFTDAAYNGGMGGVNNERRACGLSKNCNPQLWFNNVEKTCLKSKKALYSGRSACDINRHHVYDVFNVRSNKYKVFFN